MTTITQIPFINMKLEANSSTPITNISSGVSDIESRQFSPEAMHVAAIILMVKRFIPPVLIALGTIGNAMAIVIFYKSRLLRQSSVWLYLNAFVVSSTLVLYMGAGLDWACFIGNLQPIWNIADWLCRLWEFFSSVLFYSPIWFSVAMAGDRYVYVYHKDRRRRICTIFTAKIVIILIIIGLITVSIHAMWTFELDPTYGCALFTEHHDFHSVTWPWVSAFIYSLLPSCLLLLLSVMLAISLCRKKTHSSGQRTQGDNIHSELTELALSVAITNLIFTMPATLMNVYMMQTHAKFTLDEKISIDLVALVFQQCAIVNHSVVPLVCFCSSGKFRRETRTLFVKERRQDTIEIEICDSSKSKEFQNRSNV